MKILGLETTDVRGSVAAFEEGSLLIEKELPEEGRSAQTLIPTIKSLLSEVNWSLQDLDLIAVAAGPGSFTGLRVGITTAKVLGYALSAKVMGVDTLEAMALGLTESYPGRTVSIAVDAQRQEVAVRRFRLSESQDILPEALESGFRMVRISDWLEPGRFVESKNRESENNTEKENHFHSGVIYQKKEEMFENTFLFCSPILARWESRVPETVRERFVLPDKREPRASAIARLAWLYSQKETQDELWTLLPVYSRKSAAEERAALKSLMK